MTLRRAILKKMNLAIAGTILVTFAVNMSQLFYDLSVTGNRLLDTLVLQLKNTAVAKAEAGDLLSLQRDLDVITRPFAGLLLSDIDVIRQEDEKSLVKIHPRERPWLHFNREMTSVIDLFPLGPVKVRISVDFGPMIVSTLQRSLTTCTALILVILIFFQYLKYETRKTLLPLDELAAWLESVDIVAQPSKPPTAALSGDFKKGMEKVFDKIQKMAADISEAETERKFAHLARMVAHDIRSPLSALNAVSSQIPASEDQRDLLKKVSERINTIASDLLRHQGKIKSEPLPRPLPNEPSIELTLNSILQEKTIELQLDTKIRLESRFEDLRNYAPIIPTSDLGRIISNVINNSIESLGGKGTICVSARSRNRDVVIRVKDSGSGMPREILESLFIRPRTTKSLGNGLGLYHAKAVLERHGGNISVISELGHGTEVIISLPCRLN